MKNYNDFQLTPKQLRTIQTRKKKNYVVSYLLKHGEMPTDEQIEENAVVGTGELEKYRTALYVNEVFKDSENEPEPEENVKEEEDQWIHAVYNVTSTTQATSLVFSGGNRLVAMKIDGVPTEITFSSQSGYGTYYKHISHTFDTTGRHTVDFLMISKEECEQIVNGTYPVPEYLSFFTIKALAEIELPANIVLNEGEFASCGVSRITCNATVAPKLGTSPTPTFKNVPYNGVLRVPEGSDYSSWIDLSKGTNLGTYGWTIQYF